MGGRQIEGRWHDSEGIRMSWGPTICIWVRLGCAATNIARSKRAGLSRTLRTSCPQRAVPHVIQHTDGIHANLDIQDSGHASCEFLHAFIFRERAMTSMPSRGPDAPRAMSVPQLHLKAAEYLDHASRLHREAASLHAAGEPRAADLQVMMAHYLVAKVAAHVAEAGKRLRSCPAQPGSTWSAPAYGRRLEGGAPDVPMPGDSSTA